MKYRTEFLINLLQYKIRRKLPCSYLVYETEIVVTPDLIFMVLVVSSLLTLSLLVAGSSNGTFYVFVYL